LCGCTSHHLVPRRGRFAPFVDPSLTAVEAHHVWVPPAGQAILSVVAERVDRTAHGAVLVPELTALEHILIDPAGRQHVLVRANGAVLQLEIEGADILSGPVLLTFMARGIDTLGRAASQLSDLRRILSTDATFASVPRWTTRTGNLRDGFIVYDCRAAGRRYQEAAIIIHGAQAVKQNWRNGGLPARMRRNWQRAERCVSGGYRAFLK